MAAKFKFDPCSACCDSDACIVLEDDFTRADADDPGANWDELSGDWDISSNALVCSDASGLLQCLVDSDYTNHSVRLRVTTSTTGAGGRVLFDYVDASNYIYAECALYSGTTVFRLRIVQRASGSDTELKAWNATASDSNPYIQACITADWLRLVLEGTTPYAEAVTRASPQAFVVLGTTGTAAAVTFDDFRHGVTADDDPDCYECPGGPAYDNCTHCTDDPPLTKFLLVSIPGIGDYVLEHEHPVAECSWRINLPGLGAQYVAVGISSGMLFDIQVAATISGCSYVWQDFMAYPPYPYTCAEQLAAGVTIPYVSKSPAGCSVPADAFVQSIE